MKRLVNGEEVELSTSSAKITQLADRLAVATDSGLKTALAIKVGDKTHVSFRGKQYVIEPVKAHRKADGKDHSGDLISPLPGAVVEVMAKEGQPVKKGDKIVILEAMKTQQTFAAPFDGTIAKILVKKGDQVSEGVLLAVVEPTSV